MRALDLVLLRGVGFSVIYLLALTYVYRYLFYKLRPTSVFFKQLQVNLNGLSGVVVGLVPALNVVYCFSELAEYYEQVWVALLVCLGLMCIEAIWTFLHAAIFPEGAGSYWERVFTVVRSSLYFALAFFSYYRVLFNESTEANLFAGICATILVFCVLRFIYSWIFLTNTYSHPLVQYIVKRLHWWGYGMVCLLTALYGSTWIVAVPSSVRFYLGAAVPVMIAIAINESLFAAVFQYYLATCKGIKVSKLIQDLTMVIVYIILGLMVMATVFKKDLSSLLVGSTVFSVIIGLAVQESLGNLVAGLIMGFAKPYKVGDFIEVGEHAGRVGKVDWRSTVLHTFNNDSTVLPNSLLTKATILNHSALETLHGRTVSVGVGYEHSPESVRKVMAQAALSVEGVCKEPVPTVWLSSFGDSSINYTMNFWITHYAERLGIDSAVREAIWYYFSRKQISIPFPTRTVISHPEVSSIERSKHMQKLLGSVELLEGLSEELLGVLAHNTQQELYAPGEVIIRQGDDGDAFYIVDEGHCEIIARDEQGQTLVQIVAGPGECFGEMALFTGQKRSATVTAKDECTLVVLNQKAFGELLEASPDVDALLSEKAAKRKMRRVKTVNRLAQEQADNAEAADSAAEGGELEANTRSVLASIRSLFGGLYGKKQ